MCQKAKMMAPYARKTGGSATVRSEAYGDHVTMDHIIASDLRDYGFDDQRVALVVKDVFSKFRYVYPFDTEAIHIKPLALPPLICKSILHPLSPKCLKA